MTEEGTQSWLKQELDELDEAQKMIYDTISTFEPINGREQPPLPVTVSANMDSNSEVSNSQPISEADRSVAELLSSLNIEMDSSLLKKKSDPDLPPPPSLDDLIIGQPSVVLETPKMNTSKPAPPAVLPKPNKKPTAITTVKIQLKGKVQSNQPKPQPITIVAPIVMTKPPPKPAVPSKTAEPPLPTPPPKPSAPVLAPKPTPPAPAPKPTPPAPAPKPAAVPAPASSLPTLTLGGAAMSEDQDKMLADLENDLEFYTKTLLSNIENPKDEEFYGYCEKCNQVVEGEQVGCKAFDKIYHISCFNCETCKKSVHGVQFYAVNKKTFCEKCYLDSLDKCAVCKNLITDKILRASDKTYHPDCFKCSVCSKSLDGIPFTVDDDNVVYCVDDYYKRFAPKCSCCGEAIIPEEGKEETIRIVALDRDFHTYCYKCVRCGKQLSSGKDGKGCYPLNGEIMCLNCNTMATA